MVHIQLTGGKLSHGEGSDVTDNEAVGSCTMGQHVIGTNDPPWLRSMAQITTQSWHLRTRPQGGQVHSGAGMIWPRAVYSSLVFIKIASSYELFMILFGVWTTDT